MIIMMMMVVAIQITNILKCLVGAIKLASRRGNEKVKLKHETQTSYERSNEWEKNAQNCKYTIREAR
jgi:hypothetical protein